MKLTDKYEMSRWAFFECLDNNDSIEMRNLIVDSYWAACYCEYITYDYYLQKRTTREILNKVKKVRCMGTYKNEINR